MKSLKLFILFCFFFVANQTMAHVVLTYPEGGEKFYVGDTIKISWVIAQNHDQVGWNLYYSPDGGSNWDQIVLGLPVSQLEYAWIIPEFETLNGRIRVIQNNNGQNYDDMSDDFVIEKAAGLNGTPADISLFSSFSIRPNPVGTTAHFSFELKQPQQLIVRIYSIDGRLVGELPLKTYQKGVHKIPWNTNPLKPGIYSLHLITPTFNQSYKLLKL